MANKHADRHATGVITQEIFSGIQGEGVLVGVRQIFVRFYGCHLACRYCDTPASHAAPPVTCVVETDPGSRVMATLPNPLTVPTLLAATMRLQAGMPHHSVSLTGGEPLLHAGILRALIPQLHDAGLPTYLETNGLLADAVATLPTPPTYLAMDIKLPSVAGIAPAWAAHAAFLDAAYAQLARVTTPTPVAARLQVKIVFGEDSLGDLSTAATLLARYPEIPCVLQPLTPCGNALTPPTPATVLQAQRQLAAILHDVRVIPQTHVMLGQR